MDVFELVATRDNGALRTALAADPLAAQSRNAAGASLLAWTAYVGNDEAQRMVRAGLQALDAYEAIIVGDKGRVEDLLANHWDANELSPDGFTPLGLAAFFNRQDIFDLLLPRTKDVNQRAENAQHVGALHAATAAQNATMVESLLRAGADPDLRQADGFTPLHAAAQLGNGRIAGLLVLFGADPRLKNDRGEDAVHHAGAGGHAWLAARLAALD